MAGAFTCFNPLSALNGLGDVDPDWGALAATPNSVPWSPADIFNKAFSFFSKYGAVKVALMANYDKLTSQEAINVVAYLLKKPSIPAVVESAFMKLPGNARGILYDMIQSEGGKIPQVSSVFIQDAIAAYKAQFPGGGGDSWEKARDGYRAQECDALRIDSMGICWSKSTLTKYAVGTVAVVGLLAVAGFAMAARRANVTVVVPEAKK
ncbi:MAG: hypothetical protein WC718_12810 [Phycisphaerales bacterium]